MFKFNFGGEHLCDDSLSMACSSGEYIHIPPLEFSNPFMPLFLTLGHSEFVDKQALLLFPKHLALGLGFGTSIAEVLEDGGA